MKRKQIFTTLIYLFVGITAFAQIPTNGLVAYYPFNGNANDATNKGHNGIVNGATLTNNRLGVPNSAYSFNGINNYITVADANDLDLTQFTIGAWVSIKDTSNQSSQVVINKARPGGGTGYQISLDANGISPKSPMAYSATIQAPGQYKTISTSKVETNKWEFVLMTFDGTTLKIYNNNILTGSVASLTPQASTNTLTIGYLENYGRYLNGVIDDIRIYNRVLSSNELTTLYNEVDCSGMPKPTFADVNKCYDTTSFSYTATNGFTNKWYNSNNQLINNGTTFKTKLYYNRDTTYKYLVSNILGNCESDKDTVVFNVKKNPYVSLSANTTSGLLYVNSNQQTINTYPTGGILKLNNKVVNTTYNPASNGLGKKDFSYTYSAINGCSNTANLSIIVYDTVHCVSGSDTLIIKSNTTTGINLPSNFGIVKLYPNPANDVLNITYNNPSTNYKINIINSQLQVVYSNNLNLNTYQVSLNGLAKGLYFVQIVDNNTSKVLETSKLLIE